MQCLTSTDVERRRRLGRGGGDREPRGGGVMENCNTAGRRLEVRNARGFLPDSQC